VGPWRGDDSESDRVTVLFESVGYRTLASQALGDGPLWVAGEDSEGSEGEENGGMTARASGE
jgi:hypothetical protein